MVQQCHHLKKRETLRVGEKAMRITTWNHSKGLILNLTDILLQPFLMRPAFGLSPRNQFVFISSTKSKTYWVWYADETWAVEKANCNRKGVSPGMWYRKEQCGNPFSPSSSWRLMFLLHASHFPVGLCAGGFQRCWKMKGELRKNYSFFTFCIFTSIISCGLMTGWQDKIVRSMFTKEICLLRIATEQPCLRSLIC